MSDMPDNDEYDFKRFSGPLLEMVDSVFAYMPGVIKKSARLYSLFLREMPQYPEKAWHEFIVNAAVHRDYSVREREIEIWVFEDRIEIESPGRLYSGISLESLFGTSRVQASRNPKLADIFMRAGYMREVGEGIRSACGVMERSYLNPPQFIETETGFRVTLQNSPVFDVGDADWEKKIRGLDLNLNQKRILIVYGKTGFSNSDYQKINSCDRDTAYREILEIADKGYVMKEGKGRGLQYMPDIK
jgi:ATP-dependent DNA helicase RecG